MIILNGRVEPRIVKDVTIIIIIINEYLYRIKVSVNIYK